MENENVTVLMVWNDPGAQNFLNTAEYVRSLKRSMRINDDSDGYEQKEDDERCEVKRRRR